MDQIKLIFVFTNKKMSFNVTTKIIWDPNGLLYPLKNCYKEGCKKQQTNTKRKISR